MIVRVYKNLHKKAYSIQEYIPNKGWRILGVEREVFLKNASTLIYEKTRLKVVNDKKKYVHAFIVGELSEYFPANNKLFYNPYYNSDFVNEKGDTVSKMSRVNLTPLGVFYE